MKHWWKWLLGLIGVIILIVIAGAWYLSRNWKPIIETKLKELVVNATDSLYTLQYADLDVNVAFGNITIDRVSLTPDSAVYQKMIKAQKAPNNQYILSLDALKIKHFSVVDVFFNRKLSISGIELHQPDIQLIHEYHAYNDTIPKKPKEPLYNHIKKLFGSIKVGKVSVDSAAFRYTTVVGKTSNSLALGKINLLVEDILIDSMSMHDSSRIFYAKMIDVRLPRFVYNLPGGFYKVGFSGLHINTKDKYLEVADFIFKPQMSKNAFFRKKGVNIAMSDVSFAKVKLNGLDFLSLLDKQVFLGETAEISNGLASFSQNMKYPKLKGSRIGQAPYQRMMAVKNRFYFKTVFVNNVTVSYDEYSAKFEKDGVITFNKATGKLTNVTNDKAILHKDKYMRADLTAKVMNEGKLHVKFGFDMLSKQGAYTYIGTLGSMHATAFNKILVPLVNVQIASGNIKGISFNMQGTNYKNWGTFKFDYDSLKVNILGVPKNGAETKSKKALSFIVNQALINQSNPDVKGVYHVGLVQYTRVPEYSFFKTIWQSLLQGIVQCAGISAETEAKLLGVADQSMKAVGKADKALKKVEKVASDIGKGVGKVGKEVGKGAGKVVHEADTFFKKLFRKKHDE